MSAACHVSIIRKAHSSSSESRSLIRDDLTRNINATSGDGTLNPAWAAVTEGDPNTEPQCPITSPHADDEQGRSPASSLDADDTDDRLDSARRLEDGSNDSEDDMQFRIRVSRSRIRWGVVPMPEEFYEQFREPGKYVVVGHLSFGIEEQGVASPVDSPAHVYA
ncbi:hypothetical protein Daus18300_002139 [Diaporthe australafricana]|uniref:Uncharacterized protein n=1 Tax=Diaporthe australafricana TaxID=127596 RepID=A0ABR3XQF4_9PEZI